MNQLTRTATVVVFVVLLVSGCAAPPPQTAAQVPGEAPSVPRGALARADREAIDQILSSLATRGVDTDAVATIGQGNDPRALWFLRDLIRFARRDDWAAIEQAFADLTGTRLPGNSVTNLANHLISWDIPAYPGYVDDKKDVFLLIDPRWKSFFDDENSTLDWRLVEWGGVLMDDRIDAGPGRRCERCIPALDNPPVTSAEDGDWYPDERLVFGVVVGGEARAYPKNLMEVHEMVNDTLGGRRIGMPYCTLCGSAQAYFTDDVEGFRPILRTSGLLARSNKIMFDLTTMSAIDTFTGEAVSGPLREAGVELNQVTVVTSTWGAWKEVHPETTILREDGGVPGAWYPLDPLGGRDDNGPIFPIGTADPRLPVHERVLGVIADDGSPVAFQVANAVIALRAGEDVELLGVRLRLDGDGLRAELETADPLVSHEAFWFAWSQFHPTTLLWER